MNKRRCCGYKMYRFKKLENLRKKDIKTIMKNDELKWLFRSGKPFMIIRYWKHPAIFHPETSHLIPVSEESIEECEEN